MNTQRISRLALMNVKSNVRLLSVVSLMMGIATILEFPSLTCLAFSITALTSPTHDCYKHDRQNIIPRHINFHSSSSSFLLPSSRVTVNHCNNGFFNTVLTPTALFASSSEEERESTAIVQEKDAQNGDSNDDDKNSQEVTKEKSTGESILSLAIPALAGLAIDPLLTLVDTVFIGRSATNADALAGVGSAAALLTFAFYIFNFLCTATTPLVSERRAAGNENGAVAVGGQALTLAILLGLVLSATLIVGSQPLLYIMGTGNTGVDANQYAISFLQIRALAAPAIFVSSAATGILRGFLDTKTAFLVLAGANVVNFSLDVLLIPIGGMGPSGAAFATTTSEWICAISYLGILAGKLPSADGDLGSNQAKRIMSNADDTVDSKSKSMYGSIEAVEVDKNEKDIITVLPTFEVPAWNDVKPLIIASSSVFLRSLVLQISLAGAAAMAARTTSNAVDGASASVAAYQIALQLWLLCSFVCDALAAASQALVADALGKSDSKRVREVSKTVFVYSLGLGLFLATGLFIGKESGFLTYFFTKDGPTQEALLPLLSVLILAQPLNSFVFAADGVLQGASEFSYQAKTMALSVGVAFAGFFGLEYFNDGSVTLLHVWYSLILLQTMRGLTSFVKLVEKDGPINLLGNK